MVCEVHFQTRGQHLDGIHKPPLVSLLVHRKERGGIRQERSVCTDGVGRGIPRVPDYQKEKNMEKTRGKKDNKT